MANKVGFNALPHETVHWTLLLSGTAFMCFLRGKQSSRRNHAGRFRRTVGTRHAASKTKQVRDISFSLKSQTFLGFLTLYVFEYNTLRFRERAVIVSRIDSFKTKATT